MRIQERDLTDERRAALATTLGLPVTALATLRIGFLPNDPTMGACWTFAEHDAKNHIIGINRRRCTDGKKQAIDKGHRGLSIPTGWRGRDGPVYLPEGASCTLALTAMGLSAVGRPSNQSGVNHLAELLTDLPADRQIIVLGEYDQKENGDWPGRDGAKGTAEKLTDKLGREVVWALPLDGAKDARAWATKTQRLDPAISDAWYDAGENFAAALQLQKVATNDTSPLPGTFPEPIPLSQLTSVDLEYAWRLKGLLGVGSISLLSALWKAGKTTFLAHILKALAGEMSFIGQAVTPCNVLMISEEPWHLWTARRDQLGIGDHVHITCRPLQGKPDAATWDAFTSFVAEQVNAKHLELVVFDTLSAFWPVENENDASQVIAALLPLRKICDAGAGVLLVHHPRKGDGTEATAARGSGALSGFVDIILELRRFDASQRDDHRRVLTGYSRYQSTPDELVIELTRDNMAYTLLGSKGKAEAEALTAAIMRVLPKVPPGMTKDEILQNWPEERTIQKQKLLKVLNSNTEHPWERTGRGKRNDPFRYFAKPFGNSV
jgi:hypothetical protein